MLGKEEVPFQAVAAVAVQVDHAVRAGGFGGQPQRAGELESPAVREAEVFPLNRCSLVLEHGCTQSGLGVGGPGRPDDVLPQLLVVLL